MNLFSRLWPDVLVHLFVACIVGGHVGLFAPNWFAGTVVAAIIVSARLCGWSALTKPSRPRPLLLAVAVGAAIALGQHHRGEPTPGHWFERGVDYRCKTLVEIAHDLPNATIYTLAADVDQHEGEYSLARVYFKNGGRPEFENTDPIKFDRFARLDSVSGESWRVRLASRNTSPRPDY
jgi:hypothetical protein